VTWSSTHPESSVWHLAQCRGTGLYSRGTCPGWPPLGAATDWNAAVHAWERNFTGPSEFLC